MRSSLLVFRTLVRILVLAVLGILTALAYLSQIGFPQWVQRSVSRSVQGQGLSLEFASMRLDFGRGVRFDRVRVFRRGIPGPALVEAEELILGLRWFGAEGLGRLRRIDLREARLREGASDALRAFDRPGSARDLPVARVDLSLVSCDVQGLWLSSLAGAVRTEGGALVVDRIHGVVGRGLRGGAVTGTFAFRADGVYTGRVTTQFDPLELVAFLEAQGLHDLCGFIRTFSFPGPPLRTELQIEGRGGRDPSLSVTGRCSGREFRKNGVPIREAEGVIEVRFAEGRHQVSLAPLAVLCQDGHARISFTVDLLNDTVQFEGTATADPRQVIQIVAAGGADFLSGFRMDGPLSYTAAGFVNYTNMALSRIEARVEARSAGFPGFVADACAFRLDRFASSTVISDLKADMFEGKVAGTITLTDSASSGPGGYRLQLGIERVSLRRALEALTGEGKIPEGMAGRLSGRLDLRGAPGPGRERTVEGQGQFKIREASLFRLPLFGGLSDVLVRIVPGLGYVLQQTDADGTVEVGSGRARTRDLRIEGDVLSLKADGSYDLATRDLDFDVELRFLRRKTFVGEILQTILLPVSKLFKIRLRGTPEKPRWDLENF